MKSRPSIFIVLTIAVLIPALATAAEGTNGFIRGVVKDEGGKVLEGVKVQVCGLEAFKDGVWRREMRLGRMPSFTTDKEGKFMVTIKDPTLRYDFYFDKPGYAPVFVNTVTNGSELGVVLKRGMTLTGTVRHVVNGRMEPVSGTQVELQLPTTDLWYQQRTMTDHQGNYTFHVLPPPAGKKWQIRFGGENVQVDVKEGQSVKGPDFDMEVKVRDESADSPATPK